MSWRRVVSLSSMRSPVTSSTTSWIVPVKAKGDVYASGELPGCVFARREVGLARGLELEAQPVPAFLHQQDALRASGGDGHVSLDAVRPVDDIGACRLRDGRQARVVPLAFPGVITVAVFACVEAWNEYLYAFVLKTPARACATPPSCGSGAWPPTAGFSGLFGQSPGARQSFIQGRSSLGGSQLGTGACSGSSIQQNSPLVSPPASEVRRSTRSTAFSGGSPPVSSTHSTHER